MSTQEYAGAGHLLDPPHSPHCRLLRHPYLPPHQRVDYRGDSQHHGLAQFRAWDSLLAFYRQHLY